jgi:hypothetical protein
MNFIVALCFPYSTNFTRATRRIIPKDTIFHSHRRENFKSYLYLMNFHFTDGWSVTFAGNRYELEVKALENQDKYFHWNDTEQPVSRWQESISRILGPRTCCYHGFFLLGRTAVEPVEIKPSFRKNTRYFLWNICSLSEGSTVLCPRWGTSGKGLCRHIEFYCEAKCIQWALCLFRWDTSDSFGPMLVNTPIFHLYS